MILIFLDDEHNVEDVVWSPETQATAEKASKTIVVRNFNEFVKAINELKEQEEKIVVSFDNDLCDFHQNPSDLVKQYGNQNKYGAYPDSYETTGKSCLRYLLDNFDKQKIYKLIVHSKNNIAKMEMEKIIKEN